MNFDIIDILSKDKLSWVIAAMFYGVVRAVLLLRYQVKFAKYLEVFAIFSIPLISILVHIIIRSINWSEPAVLILSVIFAAILFIALWCFKNIYDRTIISSSPLRVLNWYNADEYGFPFTSICLKDKYYNYLLLKEEGSYYWVAPLISYSWNNQDGSIQDTIRCKIDDALKKDDFKKFKSILKKESGESMRIFWDTDGAEYTGPKRVKEHEFNLDSKKIQRIFFFEAV